MANRGLCSECASVRSGYLTPLQFSIRMGHTKCISSHLKSDISSDALERYSKLLAWVVYKKNSLNPAAVLKVLIKSGADVNYVNYTEPMHTALHEAIVCENQEAVDTLIKLGADLTISNRWGETPLQLQARIRGKPLQVERMCNVLIRNGADLNEKDKEGNTPLLNAVRAANAPAIKTFIKAGADVNVKNNGSNGVLSMEMLNRFLNKHERLELLINAGADIEDEKKFVLCEAARLGFVKSLDLLIKAGADVKNCSYECLDAACSKCRDKCVELLFEAGADVNRTSDAGRTALFAGVSSNVHCISRLIQAGVPINHYDKFYLNALQSFVKKHGSNKAELGLLLYAAGEKLDVPEDLRLRRKERRLKPINIERSQIIFMQRKVQKQCNALIRFVEKLSEGISCIWISIRICFRGFQSCHYQRASCHSSCMDVQYHRFGKVQ